MSRSTLIGVVSVLVAGVLFSVAGGATPGASGAVQADAVSVTSIDAPVETEAGETITVTATVENTGTTPADVTLEYRLDGAVLATDTRSLGGNETATVQFEVTVPEDLDAGTYTQGVFVAGSDSSRTTDLIVTEPGEPAFSVSGFQGPTAANTGQGVTAQATVENTGTATGSTTLQYRIAGQVVATRSVDLDPDESVAVVLEATIPDIAPGTYQQGLFVGDSNIGQTSTVTVGTPTAQFEVLSLQAPSNARSGDDLSASATVRNTGDAAGTREFQYRVGDRVVDRITVDLAAGEQATLLFEGPLPNVAAGTYQQGVYVGDANTGLTRSLTVSSPEAAFRVTSLKGPASVRSGETATATATVRNTGDARGSATLRYRIDDTTVDTETVTLDPATSKTVRFQGTVPDREPGTYQQGVFVEGTGEQLTTQVVVEEDPAAALRVSDLRAPSRAEVGAAISVSATVKNTGDRTADTRIEYRIGSRVVDSDRIDLRAGRSTSVEFEVDVPDLRPRTYTQGVFVAGTTRGQTTSLRLVERPRFEVTNVDAPTSAVVGDSISVDATIRNRGEVRATRTVQYRIGGRRVASREVQLDAGGRRTVTLSGTVPSVTPGTYRQSVLVDGDGSTTRLVVNPRPAPRPTFSVASFQGPSELTAGGTAQATATVRNTGNGAGTVTVDYRIDGRIVATRQVTLDPGARKDVTFRGMVPELAPGSYQQGAFVAGTNQGQSRTVRVETGQPRFSISNLQGPSTATVGDEITVRAEVTNTGTAAGETTIQYRLGSELTARETVDLDVGENETVAFAVSLADIDAGTYTQGVFVGETDRGQTTSLVVEGRATATPTPTDTPVATTEDGPGFGPGLAVLTLLGTVLLARLRR